MMIACLLFSMLTLLSFAELHVTASCKENSGNMGGTKKKKASNKGSQRQSVRSTVKDAAAIAASDARLERSQRHITEESTNATLARISAPSARVLEAVKNGGRPREADDDSSSGQSGGLPSRQDGFQTYGTTDPVARASEQRLTAPSQLNTVGMNATRDAAVNDSSIIMRQAMLPSRRHVGNVSTVVTTENTAFGGVPALATPVGRQPLAPPRPSETAAMIDATTEMLLEINNMSHKEIGESYRDVLVEEQVKTFTKTNLFHRLKFILKKEDLSQLKGPNDIGNYVMKHLHVTQDRAKWWLLYQGVVKKSLDIQRSNCNMAIKAVMIGTLEVKSMLVIVHVAMPYTPCFLFVVPSCHQVQ
jgi:hypothetical protein